MTWRMSSRIMVSLLCRVSGRGGQPALQGRVGWPRTPILVGDTPEKLFLTRSPGRVWNVDHGHELHPRPVRPPVPEGPCHIVALLLLAHAVPEIWRIRPRVAVPSHFED